MVPIVPFLAANSKSTAPKGRASSSLAPGIGNTLPGGRRLRQNSNGLNPVHSAATTPSPFHDGHRKEGKNVADRLDTVGKGEKEPVVLNTTPNGKDNPEGRAMNRRAELKVH